MIKIEITIPQYYNDKTPIEQYKFNKIKNNILKEFKGLTINQDSLGYWLDNSILYEDTNRIYTIIADQDYNNGIWLKDFKLWLEELLNQQEIFIVISQVSILK